MLSTFQHFPCVLKCPSCPFYQFENVIHGLGFSFVNNNRVVFAIGGEFLYQETEKGKRQSSVSAVCRHILIMFLFNGNSCIMFSHRNISVKLTKFDL